MNKTATHILANKIIHISAVLVIMLMLTGCDGYVNNGSKVYFKIYNEAVGLYKKEVDADPKTFIVLKDKDYAKDDKHAFYKGTTIPGADAATFESIGEYYARDKIRGYYEADSVKGSHGLTFRTLGDYYYSTDGIDIFYNTDPLHVCSVQKFEIINEQIGLTWATDSCYYYANNYKVPSDDYDNVQIFKESAGFAKDLQWVYFAGHKMNYNDSGRKIIDTIDAASFTVTDFIKCHDKFGPIDPYLGREDDSTSPAYIHHRKHEGGNRRKPDTTITNP